ncbi:hypothetical protein CF327_g4633 [Tilletia walkeri]|uniref:Uncharacterized protein n=2 Tax=Tilletia TaxID=13289 RepID=A0A8X7T2Q3_9BASI|nr:hypothetical protein CF327_g4633 [Tilletia walkeri]KAE8240382.1 hypothetical protein A4X13_0g7832 [Tilletia indica]KAE8264880.1 hypothetical protein A4X09_0g6832 [Tilletia walkeri]
MSTSSNNAGESVGNAIKGIFNSVNGVSESIRGNLNSAADGAGDAVAGRTNVGTDAPSTLSKEDNASVAQKGSEQFKEGVAQLKGSSA